MVPNQVRYQLRHIPIGRKGIKKFGLLRKTLYLCIPLSGINRQQRPDKPGAIRR